MKALAEFIAWLFGGTFLWSYLLAALISMMAIRHNAAIHRRFARSDTANEWVSLTYTLLWGAVAGVVGSAAWVLTGMGLTQQEGLVLWMVSFGFMLAGLAEYALPLSGAIVSLIGLVAREAFSGGTQAIVFTAVCQCLFGLLLLADGRRDTAAAVINDPDNGSVGARILSRIWIVPMLGILGPAADGVLLPVAMPMGMGLTAHRESLRTIIVRRSLFMLVSGGILAAVGIFAAGALWQLPLAALLSAVICAAGWILERSLAKKAREPWCGMPRRGIRVLDVQTGSIAQKMGLRSGDVLLRINGASVMQEIKIDDTLEKVPSMVWVDYEREGRILTGEHTDYENGISDLGFVPLARNMDLYMELVQPSWLWFSRR
ncbi:MAG: PDZ domain-containing protein [Christensenellales bacterium]|jgi:hypothetical protein